MHYFKYAILESRDKKNYGKNGDAMSWPELQTMQTTYQLIAQGERPWNALGDFLNYWFGYATDRRAELVREPIQEPVEVTLDLHQWAAFCAASVEYLCGRYSIPCPAWVLQPTYTLPEPWFTGLGADRPQIQARLRQETPAPFARRNIFCGNRMFANKYELAERVGGLSSTVPSAPPIHS
jgi:hypothetical protein